MSSGIKTVDSYRSYVDPIVDCNIKDHMQDILEFEEAATKFSHIHG